MGEAQEKNVGVVLDVPVDENNILSRPWALKLMKTIKVISKQAVLVWCDKVIKLGEKNIDTEAWTTIFVDQIKGSFEELIVDVSTLQEKAYADIEEKLANLEQICKDLHLKLPIIHTQNKSLYDERDEVMKLVQEYEAKRNIKLRKLRKLLDQQKELCMALETEPMQIAESPLPTSEEVDSLQDYIEKLETERLTREEKYLELKAEILEMVNEFEIEPNLDFELDIMSSTIAEFRLTETNMKQLEKYHQNLIKQTASVKEEIKHLRTKVDDLWEVLDEDIRMRDLFRQKNTGNSLTTLSALKDELKRLEELKTANIKIFIDKRRNELKSLWDKCHCDGAQINDFQFLYSDAYTVDLLELHDLEIKKWENYYQENGELITMLDKHLTLWNELIELEKNSESTSRYKNRGGKLLIEERARNKLSKKIPELEQNIIDLAQIYQVKNGRPFRTFGKTVKDHIQSLHDSREEEKKMRLGTKKQLRENTITPGKSCVSVFPAASTTNLKTTPRSTPMLAVKRYIPGSQSTQKKQKVLGEPSSSNKAAAKSASVKKTAVLTGRLSAERKKLRCRRRSRILARRLNQQQTVKDQDETYDVTNSTEYDAFEKDLSNKENCRSTIFQATASSTEKCGDSNPLKRKAENQNIKAPLTPQSSKRHHLLVPNEAVDGTLKKSQHVTPSRTPTRSPRTPARSPRTPGTQKLKAAPSGNLKLIF